MRFSYPLLPAEFEIPDDWWKEAGMAGFTPPGAAYPATSEASPKVPLRDIEPPFRLPGYPLDYHGFRREKMTRILKCIATGIRIEAVPVAMIPPTDVPELPFTYRVFDGLHRFYAAVAAGFTHLPVEIK